MLYPLSHRSGHPVTSMKVKYQMVLVPSDSSVFFTYKSSLIFPCTVLRLVLMNFTFLFDDIYFLKQKTL